ncbi:hypothetical protein, partial [Pseudoalteromonas rubra]
ESSSLLDDELDEDGEELLDFGGDFDDLDGPDFEIELEESSEQDSEPTAFEQAEDVTQDETPASEETPFEDDLTDDTLTDDALAEED